MCTDNERDDRRERDGGQRSWDMIEMREMLEREIREML
jgi:hypothetical protein